MLNVFTARVPPSWSGLKTLMKISANIRFLVAVIMLLSLLSPTAAMALGDGKKFFKKGLKHEVAEEWDEAVEDFGTSAGEDHSSKTQTGKNCAKKKLTVIPDRFPKTNNVSVAVLDVKKAARNLRRL